MINVALIGNPNTGKTTVFNALTGSKQYVGNWAGVTIDKKYGYLKDDIEIVDLPGIYAMDAFSNEEKIAKEYLERMSSPTIEYRYGSTIYGITLEEALEVERKSEEKLKIYQFD